MHERDDAKRYLQLLAGLVIAIVGIGLVTFAALLGYAEFIRDVSSELAVNLVIGLCGFAGLLCALVGARLVTGKRTRADRMLLSPMVWSIIGITFTVLSTLLLLRGRLSLAIPGFVFGALCLVAARSMRTARSRHGSG